MEEFVRNWGNLGIFLGIIATGLGFPMPEEVPVVIGGGLVHNTNATDWRWWLMLLTCILGVVVGDTCLYLIGRLWGRRLLEHRIFNRLLPPERMHSIAHNFDKYGVKILLFARLTPGIRAGIFLAAGILHLPWIKFVTADSIYAIPGVTLLFMLGYWFTDSVMGILERAEKVRSWIVVIALLGVAVYFVYRHLRKPVVEGSPKEMPPVVGQVTSRLDQTLETVKDKILHPHGEAKATPTEPPDTSNGAVPHQPNGEKSPQGAPAGKSEIRNPQSETNPKSE